MNKVAEELRLQAGRFDFPSECAGKCGAGHQLSACARMLRTRATEIEMDTQSFTPLNDNVLVERCAEESRFGLIVVPDQAKEKPQEGIVRAVGPGRISKLGIRKAMDVKVGDRVLFAKYAGMANKIGMSEDMLIMREDEIVGVVTE